MKRLSTIFAAVALTLSGGLSFAQSKYPSEPIRLVVGFAPGGAIDILARTLADKMSKGLGQPIIVENRTGATGTIAANHVAKSEPNGYTILMTAPIAHAVVSVLQAPLPYDALRDFVPVSNVAELALVLVVHPSVPVRNVKELIALAKEKPNQISYGSAGVGAMQHLATEVFSREVGIKLFHVPYKGSAPELLDLVAGRISMSIDNPQTVLPQVKEGKLRALAVTSKEPWFAAPDLPPLAIAAGLPDFDLKIYWGVLAPAGTPKDIVSVLNAEIRRALTRDDVKASLAAQGLLTVPSTPERFGSMRRSAFETWTTVAVGLKKKPQ